MAQISIDFSASDAATQITAAGATRSGSGGQLIEGAGYLPGRAETCEFTGFASTAYAATWMVEIEINPQAIAVGQAHNTGFTQSEGEEIGLTSITRSGTTATVECVEHGFITGDSIYIKGSAVSAWNAQWTITVVDSNTFTFTCAGTESNDATSTAVAVRVWSKGIFMAHPTAGVGTEYIQLYRQGGGDFSLLEKSGGVQVVTSRTLSSVGKGNTCLIQMCEVAGVIYVYVDGALLIQRTRTAAATTSAFQVMRVGGIHSSFGSIYMGDGLIKSFRLTNEETAPALNTAHKVVVFGDSFVTAGAALCSGINITYGVGTNTSNYGIPHLDTAWIIHMIQQCFRRTGVRYNILGHGNNGHGWSDTNANPLEADRANMLTNNPTIVWCHGSVNDVQAALNADYETSWQDHIDTILAHSTVKRVIVSTIPPFQRVENYNTAVIKKAIYEANAIIRSLATYDSRVWVWDEFAAVGGFGYDPNLILGSASGTPDPNDLHWCARGHANAANLRAALLLEALTGRNQTADRRFIIGGVSAQPSRRAMVTDLTGELI